MLMSHQGTIEKKLQNQITDKPRPDSVCNRWDRVILLFQLADLSVNHERDVTDHCWLKVEIMGSFNKF